MTLWNNQDKTGKMTVSGLRATATANGQWVRADTAAGAGKWFFSVKLDARPVNPVFGYSDGSPVGSYVGATRGSFGIFANGYGGHDGSFPRWGETFVSGSVVDLAYDSVAGRFWYRVNGRAWNGNPNANPAVGTGGHAVELTTPATVIPIFGGNSKDACTANFGPNYTYAPPAGFAGVAATPVQPEPPAPQPQPQPPAQPTAPLDRAKIGVGCWEDKGYTTLSFVEQTRFGWYYNWRPDHLYDRTGAARTVPFVPMIWGTKHLNSPIQSGSHDLLGFNEPDGPDMSHQANMTVDAAISHWPKLMASGHRLGSPATQQHNTFGSGRWQTNFMAGARSRGYRVDFMAVHYYSTNGRVADFETWLRQVHTAYGLPIWITEWCLVDWANPGRFSLAANAAFAADALRMLNALPFVERHAWFAANPYDLFGAPTHLFDDRGAITPVGAVFQDILRSS